VSRTAEPCGCTHDGSQWLKLCDPHQDENDRTRARWAVGHIIRNPSPNYSSSYRALAARSIPEFLQ
jgi:hypothetical protein